MYYNSFWHLLCQGGKYWAKFRNREQSHSRLKRMPDSRAADGDRNHNDSDRWKWKISRSEFAFTIGEMTTLNLSRGWAHGNMQTLNRGWAGWNGGHLAVGLRMLLYCIVKVTRHGIQSRLVPWKYCDRLRGVLIILCWVNYIFMLSHMVCICECILMNILMSTYER